MNIPRKHGMDVRGRIIRACEIERISGRHRGGPYLEALEPRQLLASGDPFINEFLAVNGKGIRDDSSPAVRTDWIEIRNPSSTAVNLAGWRLTDDPGDPAKWVFPASAGSNVAGNGYLLVFADGSINPIGPGGKPHANFSLDSDGEYLALSKPDGTIVNAFDPFPGQVGDVSYGSTSPGTIGYMSTPTPGAANAAGALGITPEADFSVEHGYYDDPFDLVISSRQIGAAIYYTRDGRSPLNGDGTIAAAAIPYSGPIHIDTTSTIRAAAAAPGYLTSGAATRTYLFANDIINQTDAGNVAGFPAKWINTGGSVISYPTNGQAKYGMTQSVVSRYAAEIESDLKSLPAISLVMNPDELFGTGALKGIYSNSTLSDNGSGLWERATSAEMIFPEGGDGFQIDAGVQMQGGGSRDPSNTPKHSMRLVFKSRYGPAHLDYKMFDDSDVDQFDSLILKAQYNNTWVHWDSAQRNRAQFVEDQWASDMEGAMGDATKHGRYVQLYLNGVYWGFYSLTEHPDSAWAASYLGGDKEDYDVYDNEAALIDGNSNAFNSMFSLANQMITLAGQGQSTDSTYALLQQYLDIPSFIDFMVLNQYGGNQDWDTHNYYTVRRSRKDGAATNAFGGFHYLAFDSERILESETANVTGLNTSNGPSRLYQAIRTNVEFRLRFADRVHQLMFNDGPLTPAGAQALFLRETAKIFPALAAEEARWGTYRKDYRGDASVYYSRDPIAGVSASGQWTKELNRLTVNDPGYNGGSNSGYFSVRGTELLKQYRNSQNRTYPSIDAAEWNQFGGEVAPGFKLTVANLAALPAGAILYYTTDASDPRLGGIAVAPGALVYPGNAAGIILDSSKMIAMRVYVPSTTTWSASTAAGFFVGPPPKLRAAEIMYNPASAANSTFAKDDYEFIELVNTGAAEIDPGGIVISDGISFTFPAGSATIPAGGRIVLARNSAAFAERYGAAIAVAGVYTGELADDGEAIALRTAIGQNIEQFRYSDGWFDQTDGDGFSLVANDPEASDAVLSSKEGWRSGQMPDGNPGGADPGLSNNSIVINEVMPTGGGGNWIELKNNTGSAIDISGWFLSDDPLERKKYLIPVGSVVPAGGYFSFSQTGGFGAAFALSALGGAVYLTSSAGEGIVGGYRDAIDYGASDPDVSFGRYVKSTGGSDFTALSSATRDADNAYPKVGPVVINELMYNPLGLDREYVELRNITDAPVSLAGWALTDGVRFTFATGDSIAANGYLLVVPIDPAVYRSTYGVPAGAVVVGPYIGALDNGGEKITLAKPGAPAGPIAPMIAVDRINYEHAAPWPTSPDGAGPSLGRISAIRYGNDPINWNADSADGTGGAANSFAPQVFGGGLVYGAGPTVRIQFSKDVGASLAAGDLSIVNRASQVALDPGSVNFHYDSAAQTAAWQLPADIPDANYRAALPASLVTDAQGRMLDGDGDGSAGDDFIVDFYYLKGDANQDRVVDFADLVAVSQNYGAVSGRTYAQGDFNFDGAVGFADLVMAARQYGATLAPPAPAAAAAVTASPAIAPPAVPTKAALAPAIAAAAPPNTPARAAPVVSSPERLSNPGHRAGQPMGGLPRPLPRFPVFGRRKIATECIDGRVWASVADPGAS